MAVLRALKTGKGKGVHQHLIYASEQLGIGLTTVERDHQHEIKFVPPVEPIVDPVSQVEVQEAEEAYWQCMPSGKDNHTHEIEEYEIKPLETKLDEDEIAKQCRELYRQASGEEEDARKLADEAEKFYRGDQWEKSDKDDLKNQNRAALVVNEIESKVDLLSGYQRQNRSDFKFMPVEEGDGRVADILNIVVKNIIDQNDFQFSETEIFDDGVIVGRGNVHCYIDYSGDPLGNIKVEHFAWKDVCYGPHNKRCAEDAEYAIKSKWYSKERVKTMWPDKADDIEMDFTEVSDSIQVTGGSGAADRYAKSDNWWGDNITSFLDIAKKDVRVLEVEKKEYYRVPILVDAANGMFINLGGMSKSEANSFETIPGVGIVYQDVTKIRKMVVAANTVLSDEYSDDNEDFSVIPFYAKKRGNMFWGKVSSVLDVQKEINKRHSQSVDILNKVAAYGWFYDATTFPSPKELENFRKNSAKPGFTVEVADVSRPPHMVQGTKFPQEIAEMMKYDSQKVKDIMNINMEMAGQARASQSGVAIQEQKRQGLIGNEFLFDNLNSMKKRLGKKIVRYIQKVYTPDRMMRLLANAASQNPDMAIQGKPVSQYNPEELKSILTNTDLMKYDLVVSESSFNPTTRLANFLVWSDLAGKGAPIPISVLVDMSDLPDKDKVKAAIAQESQQKQESEKMKYDMEIKKTMIAKGQPQGGAQ